MFDEIKRSEYKLDVVYGSDGAMRIKDYIYVSPSFYVAPLKIVFALMPSGKGMCTPLAFFYRKFIKINDIGQSVFRENIIWDPKEYPEILEYCRKKRAILCR